MLSSSIGFYVEGFTTKFYIFTSSNVVFSTIDTAVKVIDLPNLSMENLLIDTTNFNITESNVQNLFDNCFNSISSVSNNFTINLNAQISTDELISLLIYSSNFLSINE